MFFSSTVRHVYHTNSVRCEGWQGHERLLYERTTTSATRDSAKQMHSGLWRHDPTAFSSPTQEDWSASYAENFSIFWSFDMWEMPNTLCGSQYRIDFVLAWRPEDSFTGERGGVRYIYMETLALALALFHRHFLFSSLLPQIKEKPKKTKTKKTKHLSPHSLTYSSSPEKNHHECVRYHSPIAPPSPLPRDVQSFYLCCGLGFVIFTHGGGPPAINQPSLPSYSTTNT